MGKILNNIVDVFAIVGGLYAFYNIFVLRIFWKPKLYLNNGKLVCENDGRNTIIIEKITVIANSQSYIAKRIHTRMNKELQKTNIIFPSQSSEIEFDIDNQKFKSDVIKFDFRIGKRNKNCMIRISENDKILFINNRQMKTTPR